MTHRIQQESVKRRLVKLAAPIFVETLLIMMLGAVDTIMLSRHSDSSVAAVGVVNQIIMLTFLVFEVINLGTSVLCSQYLGAKLQKKVVQVVGVSLLVNLVVGGVISLFLCLMNTTILGWMGLGPELMADGADYMRIVGAFAFFQAISLTLSASLRSANKAIYPMLVSRRGCYLDGIQPGSIDGDFIYNPFPQTYPSLSVGLFPAFPLDRTEKADESRVTLGRRTAFL